MRLQKLNEKSVALKWCHNPKNSLIDITGYNIYINNKVCGSMSPNDQIASVNGIQEEGEYRIFIRSSFKDIESENSNEVVTRVKRKQSTKSNNQSTESNENLPHSRTNSETSSRNSSDNSKLPPAPVSSHAKSTPIIMDKIKNGHDVNIHSYNSETGTSPKKDKNFLNLMKERLSEKEPSSGHHHQHHVSENVATRIAKSTNSLAHHKSNGFLTESEKSKLLKMSESSSDTSGGLSVDYKPFSKQSQSQMISNFVIHKPPLSPPRAPSPGENQRASSAQENYSKTLLNVKNLRIHDNIINSSHKQSKSVDLGIKLSDPNKQVDYETEVYEQNYLNDTGTTSDSNKGNSLKQTMSTHSTVGDFVNSAKYSNSEPSLLNKNENSPGSTLNRNSLLRQSILFDDEDEDEDENDENNSEFDNHHEFIKVDENDANNHRDENNSHLVKFQNGKILNQVKINKRLKISPVLLSSIGVLLESRL